MVRCGLFPRRSSALYWFQQPNARVLRGRPLYFLCVTVVSCRFAAPVEQEDDGSQDENAAGEAEEEEDDDDEDEDSVRADGNSVSSCMIWLGGTNLSWGLIFGGFPS